jgi:hypothetical protein
MNIGLATRKRHTSLRTRRRRRERLWLISAAVVALGVIGIFVFALTRPQPGTAVADLGNLHINPPETAAYNSIPPTSGPHYTSIATWGVHDTPIPNELQVHNLEDGGVLVQYNCPDGCPELVSDLTSIVSDYHEGMILAPYPDMTSRIALTAWGRIDTMDAFDEDRIVRFVKAYKGIDHHR